MSEQPAPRDDALREVKTHEAPPRTVWGILRRLGPGLIIAGSIVGSGELIATTATGAQAGFWLLWLILIGCVIKVFVQVELGRYSIVNGHSTMQGMNAVPGPTLSVSGGGLLGSTTWRGNWLLWYWAVMFIVSLGQLGGIVGGVGQALAISVPLTSTGRAYISELDVKTKKQVQLHEMQKRLDSRRAEPEGHEREITRLEADTAALSAEIADHAWKIAGLNSEKAFASLARSAKDPITERDVTPKLRPTLNRALEVADTDGDGALSRSEAKAIRGLQDRAYDDRLWAAIITVGTAVVLVLGRYGLIQSFSAVMVASFTFVTVLTVAALQLNDAYAVSWSEIVNGMSFRLTPRTEALGISPLATALATFGIIGVGANELISYPYWCNEKGYARFTGPRDDSKEWMERARGWMRVMRWDAWCSMVVYTFATIAFYLLGAATLGRLRLDPKGTEMIRTLAVMYEPVFGGWTQIIFLFGTVAVLYSTFFVANASHARVVPDAMRVLGMGKSDDATYRRRIRFFSGLFPFVCLLVYVVFPEPTRLVLASGAMQAMMLPMLSAAALYFRYRRCDRRVTPGVVWDVLLWISSIGMLIAGGWLALTIFFPALKDLG